MLMPPFELHHPSTVEEAVALASALMEQGEDFDWVAGGTDVLPNYKWHINPKPHVISLAGIESAHSIILHLALFFFQPSPSCKTEFSKLFWKRFIRFAPPIDLFGKGTVRVKSKQHPIHISRGVFASLTKAVSLTVFI